jgi:hypothetical protein
VLKIRNEKLSIGKFISLVLLPLLLVGVGSYVISLYSYFFGLQKYGDMPFLPFIFFVAVYGLILMLPALMFYAIHTLSLEKRFSPSKWKLFIWAGVLGGVSSLPYLTIAPLSFIAVPMITGSLAMMIVYFVSSRRK